MTSHLEERALSARRAVEDSTAAVEPGTFTPTPSRAAGAVLVVVLLGAIAMGAWWLAGNDANSVETVNVADDEQSTVDGSVLPDEDATQTSTPTTTQPPSIDSVVYLVLDPAPGAGSMILPDNAQAGAPSAIYDIYGRADADNPFADGDLTVAMVPTEQAKDLIENEPIGEQVIIGSTTAYFESESPVLVLSWIAEDGALFALFSTSLSRDDMIGVATSIIVDGAIDPNGLDLLADDLSGGIDGSAVTGLGNAVIYGEDSETSIVDNAYLVAIEAGGPPTDEDDLLDAALVWVGGQTAPAEAWSAKSRRTIQLDGQEVLVLTRGPGIMTLAFETEWGPARITTFSNSESSVYDEALALIPTVRPATEFEVEALLEAGRASSGDTATPATIDQGWPTEPDLVMEGIGLVDGTRSDGSRWAVSLVDPGGEPRICSYDSAVGPVANCAATVSEASIEGTRWILTGEPGVAVTVLQLDGMADVEGIELVDANDAQDLDFVDGQAGPTWYLRPPNPISGTALLRVQVGDSPPREIALPDGAVPPPESALQLTIVVMAKP